LLSKSVLIVGSTNTALDIAQDCHVAGLDTTMVTQPPTHVPPVVKDATDKQYPGAYHSNVETPNKLLTKTTPTKIPNNHMLSGFLAHIKSHHPDRHRHRHPAPPSASPSSIDSTTRPNGDHHHLLEPSGSQYVDTGSGAALIAPDCKIGVKAGVQPTAYTPTGLRFSDGSAADADAVVWCTGLGADRHDAQLEGTAAGAILGAGDSVSDGFDDATWSGVDAGAESRDMWERHLRADNYWTVGGHSPERVRGYPRTVALQIKAEIEGILPAPMAEWERPGLG